MPSAVARPIAVADVTAAILAGGAGTRVGGQDKGLMTLAGKPLVERVVERMRSQAGSIVVCANRNQDAYARHGRVIGDAVVDFSGPLAGIAAALGTCASEWLATVPVDCPTPPLDLVERLGAAAIAARSACAAAHDGARREPLFALYRCTEARASAASASTHRAAVWRWQDELGVVEVDFADHAAELANLNDPAGFLHWEALQR
jgi:molybdenum cofactor guanylyltransferase